ncbi:efflux RND transporter periplasmic adaptor subunit [Nannocystis sp. SCPEA4]|uniref:efflux RND transporter periplasmic adaptor subunit n=1 Tax=Nannocystis sp. SCPEA4 TaxID=2996787 RepID=UPI0022706063|nr:efflux RND transporter periplasmic adaptor subunit [Nannocystis sp. SCPEA4]MCY1055156.1 efflux RND transporter periplasmic adaptor subunit [Nannocystis sp. SCPEA4]
MLSSPAPTRNRPSRRSLLLPLQLLVALALGCQASAGGFEKKAAADAEVVEQPSPVVVGTVERGAITATISAASTIEAERQVTVNAESVGRLVDLSVEEGDKVKEGQVLARIRFDAQANSLLRANTSLAKAQTDFQRIEQLYNERVLGHEEYQKARNSLDIAELDLRDRTREMKNTKVTAPFTGTITLRKVTEGGFVTNGAELLQITDFNTLVARVFVPEKELDRVKVGQEALVIGKAAKGRKGVGKVLRISPTVDAGTGTVKMTVALPQELAGGQGFLPGMYAEVTLTVDHREDVALVPKGAIVHDEEQTYVFVPEGDKARRVRVELGLQDAERVEIVKGLAAGEAVIVAGQTGLKDGAKIVRVDAQGRPEGEAKPAEAKPAEAKVEDTKAEAKTDAKVEDTKSATKEN